MIINDRYFLHSFTSPFSLEYWSRWIPIIELLFLYIYISRIYFHYKIISLDEFIIELLLHGNRLPIAQKENFSWSNG